MNPLASPKGKGDRETKRQRAILLVFSSPGLLVCNIDPRGIRTPVAALKGPCPRPLDDGATSAAMARVLLGFNCFAVKPSNAYPPCPLAYNRINVNKLRP